MFEFANQTNIESDHDRPDGLWISGFALRSPCGLTSAEAAEIEHCYTTPWDAIAKGDIKFWYLVLLYVIVLVLIGISLFLVYRASHPQLTAGGKSLVFFYEIASRTEANFIKEIRDCDRSAYVDDVLGQVWKVSEVLKAKYTSLKWAFIATIVAVPFWFVSLLLAAVKHGELLAK